MDRIDIQKQVHPVNYFGNGGKETTRTSAQLREKVEIAREIQNKRYKDEESIFCNAQMSTSMLQQYCKLDDQSLDVLRVTSEKYGYSARIIHKLLRLARTSADMEERDSIKMEDVQKVLDLRELDRSNSEMLVVGNERENIR